MWPLAKLTGRSILTRRLVVLILLLGLLFGEVIRLLTTISLDQHARLAADFYLTAVPVATIIIGITVSSYQFLVERERGVILLILSKPLTGSAFVGGKYVGLLGAVTVIYLLLAAMVGMTLAPGFTLPWRELLLALGVSWLEVGLLIAMAVLLATLSAPMLATTLTAAVWLTGHLLDLVASASAALGGFTASVGRAVYLLFPNLDKFNLHQHFADAASLGADYYGWTVLYAVAYIGLALLLAGWALRHYDW